MTTTTPDLNDLYRAILNKDDGRLVTLIESGADINERGSDGCTCLHLAAVLGTPASIRNLVDAGADPKATLPGSGRTPLDAAMERHDAAKIHALLDGMGVGVAQVDILIGEETERIAGGQHSLATLAALTTYRNALE